MTGGGLRETVWLIVCEATPRWTPALKAWLTEHAPRGAMYRVLVTADRAEAGRLAGGATGPAVLMVETEPADLSTTLRWLARARAAPTLEAVALLGGRFSTVSRERVRDAVDALREAGAAAVLRSTTELPAAVRLAERHAARTANRLDAMATVRESVWRRLPWQPDPAPLR